MGRGRAPQIVYYVRRLIDDLEVLELILSNNRPNKILVRLEETAWVWYGFGDASGSSFGTTIVISDYLYFQYGNWLSEDSEASSNYRELTNLVVTRDQLFEQGELTGGELFLFTDNSAAEFVYHRETLSNKFLFKLIQKTG